MKIFKVIVEGSNNSGKDSICNLLEERFTESTKLVFHSYYRPEFVEHLQNNPQRLINYGRKRLEIFLPFFHHSLEPIISLRFHVTDWVYLKLLYPSQNFNYQEIEKELNRSKTALVVLTLSDEAIKKRLSERLKKGKTGPWDKSYTSLKRKRDLYQSFFKISKMKYKLLFDTSQTTPAEAADRIVKWWESLDDI